MDREQAIKLLKSGRAGIEQWNRWRSVNKWDAPEFDKVDFRRIDLQGANLSVLNFDEANLASAILTEANLKGSSFCGADLRGAILRSLTAQATGFEGAILRGADLTGADMSETALFSADMSRAILNGTNFENAEMGSTILCNLNLADAKCLDTITHHFASTVDVNTLYESRGKIPESFLRGCGVPQNLIDYLPSLIAGMQFYSCFISHSSNDKEFARHLHARMQQERLRVWFDEADMKAGRKLHDQISEAIRIHDKLLLILSPDSMNSEWVKTEIFHARQKEIALEKQTGKKHTVLFPIRLCDFDTIKKWQCFDADTGRDLAREIREYYIPGDFQNWKDHDAFEAAFAKLLQDLRASTPPK
jgi:hypothetical protein